MLVGIFVGGRARRFGGIAKGLLETGDGRSIVARLIDVSREASPGAELVLVGAAPSYAKFGLPLLDDRPAGIGPLGGLAALLAHAEDGGSRQALALACDLPFLSAELIRRLVSQSPDALALAPREPDGPWHALSARYAVALRPELEALIANGERAFQRVFAHLGNRAVELPVAPGELTALRDWDRPEDVNG